MCFATCCWLCELAGLSAIANVLNEFAMILTSGVVGPVSDISDACWNFGSRAMLISSFGDVVEQ